MSVGITGVDLFSRSIRMEQNRAHAHAEFQLSESRMSHDGATTEGGTNRDYKMYQPNSIISQSSNRDKYKLMFIV